MVVAISKSTVRIMKNNENLNKKKQKKSLTRAALIWKLLLVDIKLKIKNKNVGCSMLVGQCPIK